MRIDEGQATRAPAEAAAPEAAVSPRARVVTPLILFFATIFSTTIAGGPAFSATLLAILVSHEMGHYLMARRHGIEASLPHFIPMPPIFLLGTLGAVISMRTDTASRNQLMDIGAAGPIAGFVIAVPAMALGVWMSPLTPVALTPIELAVGFEYGRTALVQLASFVLPVSPQPVTFFGDSILSAGLIKWLRPDIPAGWDLVASPVLLGAWGGFLVTAINLLPMGQLDGGHVLYAWSPARAELWARRIYKTLIVLGFVGLAVHGPTMLYGILDGLGALAMALLGPVVGQDLAMRMVIDAGVRGAVLPGTMFEALRPLFPWTSYAFLIWALFGRLTGLKHPPVTDVETPLTPGRRWTAIACLAIGLLTFMPSPAWLDGVWRLAG